MMKKKRWNLTFDGVEPILETYRENEHGSEYRKIYGFYPFRKIRNWFYNRKVKKHFKNIGMKTIECEGCGEGWAEWAIKEPNGMKGDIFVCQHCVGFYDRGMTRRRLEIQHRMENLRGGFV